MAEKMGKRGGKAGEKSQFSHTCSLLNQFLKKKGSLGTIGLGMSPWPLGHQPTEKHRAPTTMSLLPGVSVSAEDHADHGADQHAPKPAVPPATEESASNKAMEKAQLTIFYGGKVLVFDHFPEDKAKDLVQMAGKETCTAAPSLVLFSATSGSQLPPLHRLPKSAQDMPIARRNSLHRFLEKRKDRVNTEAPYQVHGVVPASPDVANQEGSRSWLGLGRRAPQQEHSSGSSR
ncbi:tify 10b [Musa troglodytarum]|uniref:Protein TIFY n=1 Tax=Musa troglodytarum TaxID=320322 RepID=A0A9E7GXV1_9LILI|nr:tify 10b [Musa troglodytarum]